MTFVPDDGVNTLSGIFNIFPAFHHNIFITLLTDETLIKH
ncbi:hypothetical protein [Citrobacter pasteurii]|nr:hypothetical protein SF123566_9100 [Shigella flexneri 1235-66]CEJ64940.1 hypothetical protein [Citrobacter pasteurii]